MSKNLAYLQLQNGVITFANPNNVEERLTQAPTLSRHKASGKQVARNTITYTIPKRIVKEGCDDACSAQHFLQGTSVKLANLVPETVTQRDALAGEWEELAAIIAGAIRTGNIASGFTLPTDYTFGDVTSG